jgi:hypothetical protein
MNKKTAITTAVLGILLIGIVSAGLLDYFGKITGEVEVSAPVFYLDGSVIPEGGGSAIVYRNMIVNENPDEVNDTYFFNGHRLIYMTEPLGLENFYDAEFTIKVWIKTNNQSNIAQYRILKIDKDLSTKTICEPDEVIEFDGHYNSFWKKELSCQSEGEINLELDDRLGLEITGAGGTSEYWIRTGKNYSDGMSRIEVSAT